MLFVKLSNQSQLEEVAQFIEESKENGTFQFDEEGYMIGDYQLDLTEEGTSEEEALKFVCEIKDCTK